VSAGARTVWPYTRLSRWPAGKPAHAGRDVSAPKKVAEFFRSLDTENLTQESFWVLLLDRKNALLDLVEISRGTIDASLVHPRDVFTTAIVGGAVSVILVHNHPSGVAEPSSEDLMLTRRLAQAGQVLGIPVTDHVILGSGGSFESLSEQGLI
jgi:DNA repair protein RadC